MSDLPHRLGALDAIDAPDLWSEVERRSALQPASPQATLSWRRPGRQRSHAPRWPSLVAGGIGLVIVLGVGVAGLAVVTRPPVDVRPAVAAHPTPDARTSDAAITWDNGRIRLEASELRIRVGDERFGSRMRDVVVGPDYTLRRAPEDGDSCCAHMHVSWMENGIEQALRFGIEAEADGWQIVDVRHRDGMGRDGWLEYAAAPVAQTSGERFIGDIRLRDGVGDLRGSKRVLGSLEMDDVVVTPRDLVPEVLTPAPRDAWSPVADLFDSAVRQVSVEIERIAFGRGEQRDADSLWIDTSARVGNPAEDLWMLVPSSDSAGDALTRIDAWSGDVVEVLDVAVRGCEWDIQAGPVDGDVWLIDNADAEAPPSLYQGPTGNMCVGRFPIDGSTATVHRASGDEGVLGVLVNGRWHPGADAVDFGIVDQKLAVIDGEIYLVAIDDAFVYGLYRLDPGTGDTSLVVPGVTAIARSGGRVYAVKDGTPSVLDIDAGMLRDVDIGRRRPRSHSVAGSRDEVMFSGNGTRILDAKSGEVLGRSQVVLGSAIVVDGQVFSADDRWRLTRLEGADRRRLGEFDRCERCEFDAIGATPGAVWFRRTPFEPASADNGWLFRDAEATLRRYDVETGRLTLERRLSDLRDEIQAAP